MITESREKRMSITTIVQTTEVNVGAKWLYTRLLTAFGAGLVPIL